MFEKWQDKLRYETQTEIIKQALASEGHFLDRLLELISQRQQHSIYLSGTRLDSDYCFGSADLGLVLSVLPGDSRKTARPAYHPHSTEIYVVFKGSLKLESVVDGRVCAETLNAYDVKIIPPGICHRIPAVPAQSAASLIVKTNIAAQPQIVHCTDENACRTCEKLKTQNSPNCPLLQLWLDEKASAAGSGGL